MDPDDRGQLKRSELNASRAERRAKRILRSGRNFVELEISVILKEEYALSAGLNTDGGSILRSGTAKMRIEAKKTIELVRSAMGMYRLPKDS
jgi:hypothetical protein